MVDLVGDVRVELADRVVRELGEVNDGVEACDVLGGDPADVLVQGRRRPAVQVVEPARPVVAGVETDHFVAASCQDGGKKHPDIPLGPGREDS